MAKEIVSVKNHCNDTGDITNITIEGKSDMHFWNHDLKVKAIISLLNTIDYKDYYESDKSEEAEESFQRIIEAAKVAYGHDY